MGMSDRACPMHARLWSLVICNITMKFFSLKISYYFPYMLFTSNTGTNALFAHLCQLPHVNLTVHTFHKWGRHCRTDAYTRTEEATNCKRVESARGNLINRVVSDVKFVATTCWRHAATAILLGQNFVWAPNTAPSRVCSNSK